MIDKSLPYNDWEIGLDAKTIKDISLCFKCMSKGEASPEQQQRILNFLIHIGCRTHDSDWFPDERTSSFAAGRRHVGRQIIRFIELKLGKIEE